MGSANGFRALRGHDTAYVCVPRATRASSSKGVTNGSTAWEDLRACVVVISRVIGVDVSGSIRTCFRCGWREGRRVGGLRYCEDTCTDWG